MSEFGDQDISTDESIPEPIHRPKSESESSYAATNISTDSSGSSPSPTDNEERPKKRKTASETSSTQPRVKRLKGLYNDRYRQLYNTTIEEISVLPNLDQNESLITSQIGASVWSSEEKEIFFNVLARKGRHDLKSIAAEIRSKSEPEVSQYIELLQKSLVHSELQFRRPSFVEKPSFDAAFEISPDCTRALDLCAEALSTLQQKGEDKTERSQHDKLWLLTPKIAKWSNQCLRGDGQNEAEISQALPAAVLLNLGHFLCLSKRFFMNCGDLEYNWRSYTKKRKAPTIMHTAFSDFHTLVVSITKRLLQSTLFFAMSRLKASETSGYRPKQHVRQKDVLAALDVLGMKRNAKSHWNGVARRCKMHVFENVRRSQVSGKRYTYNEVEEILCHDAHDDCEGLEPIVADKIAMSDLETATSDSQPEYDAGAQSELTDNSDDSETSLSIQEDDRPATKEEVKDQLRNEYMETMDQIQSQAEEERLWRLLGEHPSKKMDLLNIDKPKAPTSVRKEKQDVIDWTSWIDYSEEWETLEAPVPAKAFQANRRIGQGGSRSQDKPPASITIASVLTNIDVARSGVGTLQQESDTDGDRRKAAVVMDDDSSFDEEGSEPALKAIKSRRITINDSEEPDDEEASRRGQ